MNITLHLILAHFLADYPFQSSQLAKYKQKHFAGIVLHSLTHGATSLALVLPFLYDWKVWVAILIIFVQHNIFDQLKISMGKRCPKWNQFLLYLLDQVAHLAVIWWVGNHYLGSLTPKPIIGVEFFSATSIIAFLLVLTLVTYFYDVSRWTYLNSLKKISYKRDYKMMGRNALIVVIAFVLYWVTNG